MNAAPFNFQQDLQNPVAAGLAGLEKVRQLRRQEQKDVILQNTLERKKQMETELAELSLKENPTGEDYGRVMTKYPSLAEHLKKSFETLNSEQRDVKLKQILSIDTALQSGNEETAEKILETQRQAAINSGNKREEDGATAMLQLLKTNPKQAKFTIGAQLAAVTGIKDFTDHRAKLAPKEKKGKTTLIGPEEHKELGLPEGRFQRDPDGKITAVGRAGVTVNVGDKAKIKETEIIQKLRKELNNDPIIKNAAEVNQAVSKMRSVWDEYNSDRDSKETKNALDQALIVTFNKMLDPGSVVRESEFARTSQGQSLISKVGGIIGRLAKGGSGLTDTEREELVNTAERLQQGQEEVVEPKIEFFRKEAEEAGLDPERIIGTVGRTIKKTDTKKFNSVEEAEAANLPVGTRILINGRPAVIE